MKNDYQPISPLSRWLVLLLGVSTALTIAWLLLERPGGAHGPRYVAPVPLCGTPQDSGCIGGKAEVIMQPVAPAAPAPATARSPSAKASAPPR